MSLHTKYFRIFIPVTGQVQGVTPLANLFTKLLARKQPQNKITRQILVVSWGEPKEK